MMLKGLGDIGNLMRLQKEITGFHKKIAGLTMEGSSANGKVRASVSGEHRLAALTIDPDAMEDYGVRDIEEMVIEAVNSAADKIKEFSESEIRRLTGGIGVPGLDGLLK
jgi:DNA-binding YbaB/EbfC family protein